MTVVVRITTTVIALFMPGMSVVGYAGAGIEKPLLTI